MIIATCSATLTLGTGCRSMPLSGNVAPGLPPIEIQAIRGDISDLLDRQVQAWNAGDVEGFMVGYLPDENLTFLSGGAVTFGRNATLDRYRTRYPDRRAMGRLTFSELHIEPIAHDAALVWGRWRLERDDEVGGLFTLLLRKTADTWAIVHDHTSIGEAQ